MIRRVIRRILRTVRGKQPASPPPADQPVAVAPAPEPDPEPEINVEVDGAGALAWQEEGRELVFVDIRELHEINHGHISGAVIIPMNQVPERLSELPPDKTLVVYCAAGARSYGVTHYLREQGIADSWSLIGGIGAWIEQDKSSWHPPPSAAAFKTSAPARLTPAAAERLGRDSARAARAGSVQESRKTADGIRYVLGIPRTGGGMERVSDLCEDDLEHVGRKPR